MNVVIHEGLIKIKGKSWVLSWERVNIEYNHIPLSEVEEEVGEKFLVDTIVALKLRGKESPKDWPHKRKNVIVIYKNWYWLHNLRLLGKG